MNNKTGKKEELINDIENKYSLYTEKIVISPRVKYKKLITALKVVAGGLLVCLAGMLAYIFILPLAGKYIKKDEAKRAPLTIEKDEYNLEQETSVMDGDDNLRVDYETALNNMRNMVADIQKSIVAVNIDGNSDFISENNLEEDKENSVSGMIVARTDTEYLIATSIKAADSNNIMVKVSDESEAIATVLSKDEDTGICILSVRNMDVSMANQNNLKAVTLDNSYRLRKGDMIIVQGRIYGINNSVDYGTITNITAKSGTDNEYDVLETNIKYQEGDYGFVFNSKGNAVGITKTDDKGEVKVLGISSLKPLLELMLNDEQVTYCGIKGQNVMEALSVKYGLPTGIYITEVERESPAYVAGLQTGDVIVSFDGNMVLTIQSFSEKLYQCADNQNVAIGVKRLGKDGYVDITFMVTVKKK